MAFTSLSYIIFTAVVVSLYYIIPYKYRPIFILICSYYFYANWQPIYAVLLFFSTVVSYWAARLMNRSNISHQHRLFLCILGCFLPLLSLITFKYYNFITDNIHYILKHIGLLYTFPKLNLLLPVGISFYTFTIIGYLIDIYRKKYSAETNFIIYSLFIGFFTQLAAGPIPRGDQLIPQLKRDISVSYDNIMGGIRDMIWGFFIKLCVADRLSIYVDTIYNNIPNHNGGSLLLASILYSFQIYCDFTGYSLIAIGTARMLGIHLINNFKRPYFSKSIKEFWSRWHISLSTWFRDYVYIPLGGNRVSKCRHNLNLIITFLVSGLWHGAAWNFVLWGTVHGIGQVVNNKATRSSHLKNNTISQFIYIILVFSFVTAAWVFFRVQNISESTSIFKKIVTEFGIPFFDSTLLYGGLSMSLLIIKDSIDEYKPNVKLLNSNNFIISNITSGVLLALILLFGAFGNGSFIYFQF